MTKIPSFLSGQEIWLSSGPNKKTREKRVGKKVGDLQQLGPVVGCGTFPTKTWDS